MIACVSSTTLWDGAFIAAADEPGSTRKTRKRGGRAWYEPRVERPCSEAGGGAAFSFWCSPVSFFSASRFIMSLNICISSSGLSDWGTADAGADLASSTAFAAASLSFSWRSFSFMPFFQA